MRVPAFTKPVRYAILVGGIDPEQVGGKLGIPEMIDELEVEFKARGFRVVPMRENVQKESLDRLLEEAKRLSWESPRFPTTIFYYCGHHGIPGFGLNNGIYDRPDLMRKLLAIRGDKLGVFDCCHAGMMQQYSGRELAIVAATNEDYVAYAGRVDDSEKNRLLLSHEILKFMRSHPRQFPLGKMFQGIDRDIGITEWQNPEMKGSRVFIVPGRIYD